MTVVEHKIQDQKDLARRLRKYEGQWVAVREEEIVGSGKTPEDAIKRARGGVHRVFRVPRTRGASLL